MSNTLTSGTTSGLVISGDQYVLSGATITQSTLAYGMSGLILEAGAVGSFITIDASFAQMEVDANAIAYNTDVEFEDEQVYGIDNDAIVSGGTRVFNGLINYDLSYQFVYNGGVANDTTIGGNTTFTTIGVNSVNTYPSGVQEIDAGGIATDAVVAIYGRQIAYAGGTAENSSVDTGGMLYGDGTVSSATINSGGFVDIASSAVATGTIIFTGTESIFEFAQGATIDAAFADLYDGGTIILVGVTDASGSSTSLDNSTNVLDLTLGGTSISLSLSGDYNGVTFDLAPVMVNGTASTELTAANACFAAGTRILKPDGALAPVEALRPGDTLQLYAGETAKITWIGHRHIDLNRHPLEESVQPILISTGALSPNIPLRDLVISPDHALYLDGHLIPAKALLNGFSIRRLNRRSVSYYHIELSEHAVLFAEGAAAESYLETGNRAAFENGGPAILLHPDFAQNIREQKSCAPFAESGPVVEAVRQRILCRAGIKMTDDPYLRIRYENGTAIISSRSAIPGELFADPRDRRRLGVKIARLEIGGSTIQVDHPSLVDGWHDMEPDGRWTDGRAVVPRSMVNGAKLRVILAATLRYPVAPSHSPARQVRPR